MSKFLYANIVDDLESKIKKGDLIDGTKLPSERLMAEKYNVSRNVVREAFKVMAEKGLVEIHIGKGAYVSIPKENVITSKLQEAISISKSNLNEILEVRKILEEAVAKRAIQKATKENIRNLEEIYNRMESAIGDTSKFTQEDINFHIELAKCTGNLTLVLLIDTFNNISDKKLYKLNSLYPNRALKAQAEHKDMIRSIKNMDEKKMMMAVDSHINCLASEMEMLNSSLRNKHMADKL
ncbi:FadR/GntR family transcriptional regulator [Clostridium kluyveri]|uniref:FadR/GntR family transcriptional regulator n=1 Tax=Clostridium kluyveri TaxID=1534 RepID=UPI002247A723|nr:FCD domain-containing protein [Clostridium kluyveri]UZQ50554.1 FCD domain-containing protein [Clostridium kluyveri]